MVPDVSTGSDSRGLIVYLFGPGRRDEHTDPHIVAAWDMAGAPDPGRDPTATYTQLAKRLDAHVDLRTRELGGKKPPQHVWHCPVRTAPGDRYLTDAEWAEVARIVHATGIAPEGDERACRWIAVRHADDHIHVMATTVRADGRRPRTHRDGQRAQAECRKIEAEFGLRRLKAGDLTAPRTPTGAERAKAERQGQTVTARHWLREQAYAVAAAVHNEADYFTVLQSLGIKVKTRLGPDTGDVIGYSLAAPGDTNAAGEPVWYGGSKLAPDLSTNRLRERLPDQEVADRPRYVADPADPWRHTTSAIRAARTVLDSDDDAAAQGYLAAFGDALYNIASATTSPHRAELQAAAMAFNCARRSATRADHQAATALRKAAKELAYASNEPGGLAIALLFATVHLARAAAKWHEQRGHEQQAAAAEEAFRHLQAGYQQAAAPALAGLARRAPRAATARRYEQDVRAALPDHADRILADPTWTALTTTLAHAETAGQTPRRLLTEVAAQRELDSAEHPAEVLNWRITAQPNRRKQAARSRSTTSGTSARSATPHPPATPAATRPEECSRHC
ncbi:relaxase/mobilization nuclease domain-containing protein [Streptomyces goshikiensis]|uniref:relaxase/mobilization nuclease domain-containing protein n=1 Tax=Streptomyces goshikiensis TaxID=1942 RepID=UPI00368D17FB